MRKSKKQNYTPLKKHFWIPFLLSVFIIVIGIVMAIMNSTDNTAYYGKSNKHFELTGYGAITLGILLASFFIIYRFKYMK